MEELSPTSIKGRVFVRDFESDELFEIRLAIFNSKHFNELCSIYRNGVEFLCWYEDTNFFFKVAESGYTAFMKESYIKNTIKVPSPISARIALLLDRLVEHDCTEAA